MPPGGTGTTGTPIVVHFSVINSGSTTTTLTLPSAADTYALDGASTDQNFGQLTTMLVKNVATPGFDRRSFVRFDLTGVAAADQITSAKVRLFGNLLNTAVTGMPIGLYSVANTAWSETALTWTNQPAAGATPLVTNIVAGTTGAWYEFDVTNYLKAQKAAGATAVAFMLDGTTVSQGYATFNSHEATSNPRNWSSRENSVMPQQAIVASAGAVSVPRGRRRRSR